MKTDQALRLLVVDDEEGMRLGIERGLKSYLFDLPEYETTVNYEITLAADGETAVEILKQDSFDLILLDYMLPGINGLDVLLFIQQEHPETTVIMVTAFASLEVAVSATKHGAYDFLAKPFSPTELRNVVSKATKHIMTLREARRLADEKRHIRFEFLSVLAHELKSPLAAVENYLQLMDQRISGNDLETYDHSIKRSLIRLGGMRKMILDLLDLTRLESGQFERHPEWVDVKQVVETSLETLSTLAEDLNIRLSGDYNGPCKLFGVSAEIEILLNNFISNAIKYNRENGSVDVKVVSDSENIRIEVADTGIGMTEEEASRLFGEFVRIHNEKTRNIQGSGLGLSIVNKIVRNLDGSIKVTSTPDVGSTFTVDIPVNKVAAQMLTTETGPANA